MKKGRHRRFEEARLLKRANEELIEPCAECGAKPGADHATWCLAMEDDEDEEYESRGATGSGDRSAPGVP